MLDERKAAILRAVVEEYIDTAQPVGSGHVVAAGRRGRVVGHGAQRDGGARAGGLPAQPHTSAGRVPTEKGYRFFVDHLGQPGPLGRADAEQVRAFFDQAHGELEQMLRRHQPAARRPHRLRRGRRRARRTRRPRSARSSSSALGRRGVALLVVVLSNGVVEKHTIELRRRRSSEADVGRGHRRTCRAHARRARPPPARRRRARRRGDAGGRRAWSPRPLGAVAADAGDDADHVFVGGAVADGRGVRRRRDRPRGARHPRAAVRRGHAPPRRRSTAACTWPSAPRPAWSRWPSARWSSRPTRSRASRPARSACSARPA